MSDPFDSVGSIFKVQTRAVVGVVIGIIAGVVLGVTVSWQAGLITGLVVVGLSVIYAVVAGARAAKSAFSGVAGAAGEVFADVKRNFDETERPQAQRPSVTAFPAFPPMQYGQAPTPRIEDYRDVAMSRVNDLREQKKADEEE